MDVFQFLKFYAGQLKSCALYLQVDQINAEYKAKALIYHPDKNPHDPSVVLKFQRIQVATFSVSLVIKLIVLISPYIFKEAKEVLCDVVQRKEYDKWRSGGISIPYKQWMSMKKNSNTVCLCNCSINNYHL